MFTAPCFAALVVAVSGCGGESGPRTMRVWGVVTYDGKPVEDGTIDFVPTDGSRPAQGQIKAGRYDLPTEAGPEAEKTYRVQINSLVKTGKSVPNLMPGGDPTMETLENIIPVEYNGKSTLSATISPDSAKNQFDFKLAKGSVARSH
jgi:hypothetical protein